VEVLVTTMNHPLPAAAPSSPPATPPGDRETDRLLRLWGSLTRQAAAAAAHRVGREAPLRDLQQQVEELINDRIVDADDLWAELWSWEASLIHFVDTSPKDCLTCRRAHLDLPTVLGDQATPRRTS
jgi:hypothetical protein